MDLLPGGMPGPPESKWCQNRLRPYLCLGPEPDAAPGDQEAEEYIEVGQLVLSDRCQWLQSHHWCGWHAGHHVTPTWPMSKAATGCRDGHAPHVSVCHAGALQVHRVTIPRLRRILRSRQMMLPSVCTCYYALDELTERGLL